MEDSSAVKFRAVGSCFAAGFVVWFLSYLGWPNWTYWFCILPLFWLGTLDLVGVSRGVFKSWNWKQTWLAWWFFSSPLCWMSSSIECCRKIITCKHIKSWWHYAPINVMSHFLPGWWNTRGLHQLISKVATHPRGKSFVQNPNISSILIVTDLGISCLSFETRSFSWEDWRWVTADVDTGWAGPQDIYRKWCTDRRS